MQTLLVRSGAWPTSFIEGAGVTPFDRAVLYCAIVLFALSAVMLRLGVPSTTTRFRRWYALGLGLIALGLISVSLQLRIGDPLNWVGRGAQYLGAVFMLVAVVSTVRERGDWLLPLERALRESEARYRRLIEVSPDAVLVVAGGEVVFANPAAADLFAAAAPDSLVGRVFRSLFRTSDQQRAAEIAEQARVGGGVTVAEVVLQPLGGEPVEAEIRAAQVEFGGHRAAQLIVRDISERRRVEGERQRALVHMQRIAVTLQENFIRPLPTVPGVEFGIVSQAAYEPGLVGGDFSDVFEVADGRVAVLIGDVAGKGVKAAGLTETVRSTVRALAAIDASPAFVSARPTRCCCTVRPRCASRHRPSCWCSIPSDGPRLSTRAPVTRCRSTSGSTCMAPWQSGPRPAGPQLPPRVSRTLMRSVSLDDYLLLYTEGSQTRVATRRSSARQLLGEAAAHLRGRSVQEIAEGVRDAALVFAGSLRDDLQVVCLRLA